MSENLEMAAKVHYSFLPEDYEDDRVSIAVSLRPLRTIGGDYCSILPLDDDHILVTTCDAVGHDAAAALFAARINTYVLTHAKPEMMPCDLVAGLNTYLCQRLSETGMYATFYALLLDFKSGTMTLSGAAHPPVLQLAAGEEQGREWASITTLLGIEDPMPLLCGSERILLNPGDRFLLYSDGLIEVENSNKNPFATAGLTAALKKHRRLSGAELNAALMNEVEVYAEDGFSDDLLLMSLAIK